MPTKKAIAKLKEDLLAMAEMGEHALATALMALVDRDAELACYVIDYRSEIEEMNLYVDNDCLNLMKGTLANEDLRFIAATLKINGHLDRLVGIAVTISEQVLFLIRGKSLLTQLIDADVLFEQVSLMMRESVSALVEADTKLAWKIIEEQCIVDDESELLNRQCIDLMKKEPRAIERCAHLLAIVQGLVRVAEQAANIAEEVVFIHDGTKIRHHPREFHSLAAALLVPEDIEALAREEEEILKKGISRDQAREDLNAARKSTQVISQEEVAKAAKQAKEKGKAPVAPVPAKRK